jgi:hypothetical protein
MREEGGVVGPGGGWRGGGRGRGELVVGEEWRGRIGKAQEVVE